MLCSKINIVRLNLELESPCWWILCKTNILTYQFLPKINYVASKEESATREPKSLHGRRIEFLVQDPSYCFFIWRRIKLSLSKVFEYRVTLLQLDPSYCFFIWRKKLSLCRFFFKLGDPVTAWPHWHLLFLRLEKKKKLSLSKILEYWVTLSQLDPSYCFFIKRRKKTFTF